VMGNGATPSRCEPSLLGRKEAPPTWKARCLERTGGRNHGQGGLLSIALSWPTRMVLVLTSRVRKEPDLELSA